MGGRSRLRNEAELGRGKATRSPRACILVVCEGRKTEPQYLKALCRSIRLHTVEVRIVGQGAEVLGVVDAAKTLKEEREEAAGPSVGLTPFDEVWCVVDTEGPGDRTSWEQGSSRATALGFRLAWSNPCFEYWLLLHFERIGRSFPGYAALRPFLTKYLPHYNKSEDCFEKLAPNVPIAIENAKHVQRSQWQDTPRPIDRNPGTTVHELVERLLEVAETTIAEYRKLCPTPKTGPRKARRPKPT